MKPYFIQQVEEAQRQRKIMLAITVPLKILGVCLLIYLMVAGIAWQINNPKGNQFTFWSHLPQALKFESVPSFQE